MTEKLLLSKISALEERRDIIDNQLREYYYSNIVDEEGDVVSYADYFDQYQDELRRH
ncbi:MAG: hypothetical protein PT118_04755 [Aphanizomenon gracile PMC644.10]|nr:hypothetical protein [Aphanizomenon gracile PMC644.10]